MLYLKKCTLLAILSLAIVGTSFGQKEYWTNVSDPINNIKGKQQIVPQKFSTVKLDFNQFKSLLLRAPLESPVSKTAGLIVSFPMPDGSLQKFMVVESPIMEPELAAKFPNIKTYLAQGIDDKYASMRFDITSKAFHGMILSPNGAVFIDPYSSLDAEHYISYYKKDFKSTDYFSCEVEESRENLNDSGTQRASLSNGEDLRIYRLAVAATGEYTGFHGGTVALGQQAIVTAINRVNEVYEVELAVRLVLVANNNLLVYTNPGTDPYSNNNGGAMLSQNQTNIDVVIGSANYDIGHVFSTGGGGVAGLGVVCNSAAKAKGVTGQSSPIGDPFYIDYVAHEIGHQFSGNHTFNGTSGSCSGGNRNASTAYEPGSGSTIQAYAGICGTDDLQNNSDPYFHVGNLDEMITFTTIGAGNSCPTITANGNTPPVATAPMPTGLTIPINTPFELTGSGTDVNGDAITYCWEQYDLGPAGAPDSPVGNAPLFRSFNPTTDPVRTFPRLSDLLDNTITYGEILPSYTRSMNFRLTLRDNRAGGGGVDWTSYTVDVSDNSGPFLVTVPNTAVSWLGGTTETVTWDVANTTAAPVNCTNVDILLSTDGGLTFPITLASGVTNDGSHDILVPNTNTILARVKVIGSGNIFFDISNNNFSVEEHSIAPVSLPICESFETDGEGTRYESNHYNNLSNCDYWFRTVAPLGSCNADFTGQDGSYYWAAEDVPSSSNGNQPGLFTLAPMIATGLTEFEVSILIGANSSGSGWETNDVFRVQAQVDGGGWITIGAFYGDLGDPGVLREDANLDGVADPFGTPLGLAMQSFTFGFTASGTNLEVRLFLDNDGEEELVFDSLCVSANCIPDITNITQGTSYCTLQDAIAAANADDNITIGTGTFVESGQIVIDKNLTITGNGKAETVIMTDLNTGSSSDARGWWLVNDGVELNLSDLTLDGTGYLIWQAIRQRGSGTIDNVRFTEIKYNESGPSYSGVAVAAFGSGNVDITNCMFDEIGRVGVLYFGAGISASNYLGNMYTGKGVGDWLDYGLDISAGAVVLVNGSTFSNNRGVASVDGSISSGILVTTFFGAGTIATISDNLFTDNSNGVLVGFDASDASVANVHENNFIGNDFGVQSTAPLVDAKFNYWGAENGPTHASHTCGTGDAITDNVLFIPYYQDAPRSILGDACATLPDAVAHWPFAEGSGANTEDVTVNTNDGTLGWGAHWVPGMMDFAVGFDGVNDRVSCGPGPEMNMGTGDFSISTWVKMGPQGNSYPTLITKGAGNMTDAGYWVFFKNSVLWFYLSNGTTRLHTHSSGINLTDNAWHHVAVTVDRDGDVTFYLDGEEKGTTDVSVFNGQDISSSKSLTIGSWGSSSFSFLGGSIDDTRLFDLELTAEEVTILSGGDPGINFPPVIVVEAVADPATVLLPGLCDLTVVAEDPNFDLLTYSWTKLSGIGTVIFTPNNDEFSDMTSASFSTDGSYTLQVAVSDGLETVYSQVDVLVLPPETMNPVAYWPMDEGSGGTTEDVTVNTNDGTLYNGASWTPGVSGTGLQFDGINDRVNCGPGSEMDMGAGDFSVSTWVKMGSQSNSYPTLLSKGGGSTTSAGYWVFYRSSVLWFYLSNGTTRLHTHSMGVNLTDNAWHHVAITVDRDGDITFYVDAVNKGTFDVSSFNGQDISTSTTFTMGSWQTSSFTYMGGSLDDMRLFNAALPAPTVTELYNLFPSAKSSLISETDTELKSDLKVYPNPFNDRITISYSVEQDQHVMISVFNIHGEVVHHIQDGTMTEGTYRMVWDGRTHSGMIAPKGIYVVRIIAGDKVDQKTIVRTK